MFSAMGIGRFAFTPILPLMQAEFQFSDSIAGLLASANYFGYLAGAILVKRPEVLKSSKFWFYFSSLMTILCVAGMGFESFILWYILRFLSGVFSGFLFVISSEYIFNFLLEWKQTRWFGTIYAGIGSGLVTAGLMVPYLSQFFNSLQIWMILGGMLIPVLVFVIWQIPIRDLYPAGKTTVSGKANSTPIHYLYLAYFLEGLGYITTATFISVIILRGTGSMALSGYAWVITGIAMIIVTPFWSFLAERYGARKVLALVYFIQAVAITLSVVSADYLVTLIAAFGFGGTMLGVVALTLAMGKKLDPTGNPTAMLTIYFSIGQLIGPSVAGILSDHFGGFDIPVLLAAGIIVLGGLIVLLFQKDPAIESNLPR